jgi:hypothetical protein
MEGMVFPLSLWDRSCPDGRRAAKYTILDMQTSSTDSKTQSATVFDCKSNGRFHDLD